MDVCMHGSCASSINHKDSKHKNPNLCKPRSISASVYWRYVRGESMPSEPRVCERASCSKVHSLQRVWPAQRMEGNSYHCLHKRWSKWLSPLSHTHTHTQSQTELCILQGPILCVTCSCGNVQCACGWAWLVGGVWCICLHH